MSDYYLKRFHISGKLNEAIIQTNEEIIMVSERISKLSNEELSALVGAFEQFVLILKDLIKEE